MARVPQLLDTVALAASGPDREQPWAELGLRADEYARIREILGRRPTSSELAMYSVMWSEHCSYKSSKVHLRQLGEKLPPEAADVLLVGIGENAGVVDVGQGYAVTFKVESHNHPSYVEPYQGAATGVGGIVRDILTMGARPVAVMGSLRFGSADAPDTARVLPGVVGGGGGYGSGLGAPSRGGERCCATSELASAGTGGMHVDLDAVPLRDSTLTPAEILMSESQERMCAIVEPGKVEQFLAVCRKWDVLATVIGEVTDGDRL